MCEKINVFIAMIPLIIIITQCEGFRTECFVENGTNSIDQCPQNNEPMINCKYLNELESTLIKEESNIQVLFCSVQFTFTFNIEMQGLHNVSFIGHPSVWSCSAGDAGLTIINSTNISITNITFEHCSVIHNSTSVDIANNDSLLLFRSAVYIFNSTDITLESVTISYTNGLGLALIDTGGSVVIRKSVFANNSVNRNETKVIAGGGGVYVEFTYCLPSQYGTEECDRHLSTNGSCYQFDQSNFTGNIATSVNRKQTDFSISKKSNFLGLGRGGGLNVVFRGATTNNTVILNQCQFIDNSAIWGGGLKVTFRDEVTRNSFYAYKCVFDNNQCNSHAGGGADVGYSYFTQPFPSKNKIVFYYCSFTRNTAKFGGGLAFYSSSGAHEILNNTIEFEGCVWSHNRARYGSAVDISTHAWATVGSGYLPSPQFKDTVFFENYVIHKRYGNEIFSIYKKGTAAFLATEFTINFFGTVNFTNNNGSALVLVSCVAIFEPYTNVVFDNNSGFNGGAIALVGFSVLTLNDNMSFTLSNNQAIRCGGAIYSYSIDKHDYVSSRTCFFHNDKVFNSEEWVNSSVIFVNNKAGTLRTNTSMNCGHSICATTLLPCFYACKKSTEEDKVNLNDTFKCFANFTFINSSNRDYELITSGANFTFIESSEPIRMIPSKEESLPVALLDDFKQSIDASIFLDIDQDGAKNVQLDRSYAFLSDNKTVLHGQPGTATFLTLSTNSVRENAITLKLEVHDCPPGYIIKDDQCVCSAGSKQFYSPVYSCSRNDFVAIVHHGYWIGYVDGET